MDPSGILVAPDTVLHAGKLYLMILAATALASPFGAAPIGGSAAQTLEAIGSRSAMVLMDSISIGFFISCLRSIYVPRAEIVSLDQAAAALRKLHAGDRSCLNSAWPAVWDGSQKLILAEADPVGCLPPLLDLEPAGIAKADFNTCKCTQRPEPSP